MQKFTVVWDGVSLSLQEGFLGGRLIAQTDRSYFFTKGRFGYYDDLSYLLRCTLDYSEFRTLKFVLPEREKSLRKVPKNQLPLL